MHYGTHKVCDTLWHTWSGECFDRIGNTNLIGSTINDYRRGQHSTDTACGLSTAHTGVLRVIGAGLTGSRATANVLYSVGNLTPGHTRCISVGADLIVVTVERSISLVT